MSISFTADNPQSWTQLSTHTETEWTFDSVPVPADDVAVQPAIVTDYDVDVDLRNRTRDRDFRLDLSHLDGSDAPIDVTVEASYDDGDTWKRAKHQRAPGDPAPRRRLRLAAGARPRRRRLGAVPADHPGVVRALTAGGVVPVH